MSVLLLILLPAALAIAAPTITANPNPVLISFLADSGTTTIQWDAEDNHPNAQVWLSVDQGSETLFDGDHTGNKSATIFPGKTYAFNLRSLTKVLLDSITVTAKKKYFKPPTDLLNNFIENVVVESHGTFVKIKFTTKRDSLPVALVSEKEPIEFPASSSKDEPMWAEADLDEVRSNFAQPGTNHEATLASLEPGKVHHFVLAAHDKQTQLWFKEKGSFTTLRRRVAVTFEKVKVTDDSDDLSPGDLAFAFRIDGNLSPNGKDLTFGSSIGTDESKNLNLQATILKPGPTIKINVVGFDDDETEWVPIGPFIVLLLNTCGKGAISEKNGSGEVDCGEWTGTSQSFSTTILADGEDPNAAVTKPILLKANPVEDDSELAFEITGKYTISYVP